MVYVKSFCVQCRNLRMIADNPRKPDRPFALGISSRCEELGLLTRIGGRRLQCRVRLVQTTRWSENLSQNDRFAQTRF
jgi:hypothetical protein